MGGVRQRRPSAKVNEHKDLRSFGLREDIKVSLELSFGICGEQKQDALKRAPTQANRGYKTETPRTEPGRSNQQKYCTTTVLRVKLKNQGQKKEKSKPAVSAKPSRAQKTRLGPTAAGPRANRKSTQYQKFVLIRPSACEGYSLEMRFSTSAGGPLALTRGQTSSILASLPMRKELRTMPMDVLPINCFSCQAPNIWVVWWSGSLSRGKFRFSLALKEAWASTESALSPRMATPSLSKSFFASRNSDASIVQPEVLALGKRKSKTRWAWKSFKESSLPWSVLRRKSGALAPGFSIRFASSYLE